jgi:ubiquinone biosynthesis O-methyltransferase
MITARSAGNLRAAYARWRASRLGTITDALESRLIFELLGPAGGLRILDVGCGDGVLSAELARQGANVTGLDADRQMLAAAHRRADESSVHLDLVLGRAEALPFDDAAFDRVLAATVLCFVGEADRAMAEMARVLKPGGRLVVGELGRLSLWAAHRRLRGWLGSRTWRAARFWTARELRRLMETAGLDGSEVRGSAYYPPFAVAAQLLAPIDAWLGRRTTLGAAFIAMSAIKPV